LPGGEPIFSGRSNPRLEHAATGLNHARRSFSCLSMIFSEKPVSAPPQMRGGLLRIML
jgi:hypothetical protein